MANEPDTGRLVVVIDRYLPILGGAQQNVHQLCRSLSAQGWHVTVLTRRLSRDLPEHETLDGIEVHRLGWSPVRMLSKARCGWAVARWLEQHRARIDVVLTCAIGCYSDLLGAYLGWRRTGIPYVLRGSSLGNNFTRLLGAARGARRLERLVAPRALWRRVLTHAADVIAQSPVIAEEARRFGIEARVIPNGVDTERFTPRTDDQQRELRRRLGLPEDRVIAVCAARYVHQKNQQALIQAAERLEHANHPGRLTALILGTTEAGQVSSNERELKDYVAKRGLDTLVRFVDDADCVDAYLGASDIFVFPSKFPEGMSNALLEAMATGLPILASDAPQIRCMFPADMEGFFDPDDIAELTRKLAALIEDPTRRDHEGATLAAWARTHYASATHSQAYSALLARVAFGPATESPTTPASATSPASTLEAGQCRPNRVDAM